MIIIIGMELYDTGGCKPNVVSIRGISNLLAPVNADQAWKKVSGGQPWNSSLNFDLHDIFINDLAENIKNLFTKFVVDLKKNNNEQIAETSTGSRWL